MYVLEVHTCTRPLLTAHSCPATKAATYTATSANSDTTARRRCHQAHTVFQLRFRLIKLPVVRNPLSPMAPRHSIDNWPRLARPSCLKSFWRASRPSWRPSSCSTKNATCSTSRGLRVGGADADVSANISSQFRDRDLKGGLGFNLVCCYRMRQPRLIFQFRGFSESKSYCHHHSPIPHIFQLCL